MREFSKIAWCKVIYKLYFILYTINKQKVKEKAFHININILLLDINLTKDVQDLLRTNTIKLYWKSCKNHK